MKIRSGFVSNSSTSSFCILGVDKFDDERLFNRLLNAMKPTGVPEDLQKESEDEDFDGDYNEDLLEVCYGMDEDICAVGADAESRLQNEGINQAVVKLAAEIKEKLGVDVPAKKIKFLTGACPG